jgi:uncharacterized NAD(P)/FAD-binding protein YdhS
MGIGEAFEFEKTGQFYPERQDYSSLSKEDLDALARTAPTRKVLEWMCEECHRTSNTNMNIGLRKKGPCDLCGSTNHWIYQIEKGQIT